MRKGARIAFAVIAVLPLVLAQGRPDLVPAWIYEDCGGVPLVVWLAMGWFAMFVVATWVPLADDGAAAEAEARP